MLFLREVQRGSASSPPGRARLSTDSAEGSCQAEALCFTDASGPVPVPAFLRAASETTKALSCAQWPCPQGHEGALFFVSLFLRPLLCPQHMEQSLAGNSNRHSLKISGSYSKMVSSLFD